MEARKTTSSGQSNRTILNWRRRQQQRNPTSFLPAGLALVSFLLILLYIAATSTHKHHHHHHHGDDEHHDDDVVDDPIQHPSPIFILTSPQFHHDPNGSTGQHHPFQTTQKEQLKISTNDQHDDDGNGDHDDYVNGNDEHDHQFNSTYLKPALTSSKGLPSLKDIYHDKATFFQDYQQMKKKLKIYVYPHKGNDPFANALLPSNQDPGGNYASEAYFKISLMKSHFITKDPSEADFFFLPFSIAALRHDRRIGVPGLQDFIRNYVASIRQKYSYWNRTGGADHFYVACHSIGRHAMEKAEDVKANSIQVVCSSSYFLPNYVTHKDVSLPQIWPRQEEPPNLATSNRTKLAFFAGAVNSPVRKTLLEAWSHDPDIFAHSGRLKTPYSDQLLRSKFCLHVKGFEVNTARIADSIFYGCVPVIIADYYDLPFMDVLNWGSFSVVVNSREIPKLKKILQGISEEEYGVMKRNVMQVRRHFMWNRSAADFDTFHMVMYELWLRRGAVRVLN